MTLRRWVLVAAILVSGCGSDPNPGGPSPTPTPIPPTPPPILYTITGLVTLGTSATPISGATVQVVDGPNAGKSASTDGNGRYTIDGLTFAGFSVAVSAPTYLSTSRGIPLTAGVTSTTANFSLLPAALWTRSGSGNTVFDMPTYFPRVRIQGTWSGTSNSNFIVYIGSRLTVNEILRQTFTYTGVHLTNGGGVVQVVDSGAIRWTFTEER